MKFTAFHIPTGTYHPRWDENITSVTMLSNVVANLNRLANVTGTRSWIYFTEAKS